MVIFFMEISQDRVNIQEGLKFLMARKGIRNFQDLARRMNLHPSTLSIYISRLGSGEGLPKNFIGNLAEQLYIEQGNLKDFLFNPDIPTQDLIFLYEFSRNRENALEFFCKHYTQDRLDLLTKLGKGAILTYITCEPPIEHSDPEFKQETLNALERKVVFRYIFPDKDGSIKDKIKPYLTEKTLNWQELEQSHQQFLSTLKHLGVSKETRDAQISYRTTNDPILISPLYNLFHLTLEYLGLPEVIVFQENKVGNYSKMSERRFWSPLPRIETQHIDKRIKEIFDEA